MWLDSRPVIEQLTEPLPAQIVQEELSFATDRALDAERAIGNAVRLRLDEVTDKAGLTLGADEWECLRDFVAREAAEVVDHIHHALRLYADAVTNRLETP